MKQKPSPLSILVASPIVPITLALAALVLSQSAVAQDQPLTAAELMRATANPSVNIDKNKEKEQKSSSTNESKEEDEAGETEPKKEAIPYSPPSAQSEYRKAIYTKDPKPYNCAKIEILTENIMASSVEQEGKLYFPGEPNDTYQLKITNQCFFDALVVVGLDGKNIVDNSLLENKLENSPGFILPVNSSYIIKAPLVSKIDKESKGKEENEKSKAFIFRNKDNDPVAEVPSATNSVVKETVFPPNIAAYFFKEYEYVGLTEDERVRLQTMPGGDGFRRRPAASTKIQPLKEVKITTPPQSSSIFGFFSGNKETVVFEKENSKPFKNIEIDYDSRENLVLKNILK